MAMKVTLLVRKRPWQMMSKTRFLLKKGAGVVEGVEGIKSFKVGWVGKTSEEIISIVEQ
jgi:hypothetical protein